MSGGGGKRVLVRLVPSIRYIPVSFQSDDCVIDICRAVARNGVNPSNMNIYLVQEGGRSAPDKASEVSAWERGPLSHGVRLRDARIEAGAWLIADEEVEVEKPQSPGLLAQCGSRLCCTRVGVLVGDTTPTSGGGASSSRGSASSPSPSACACFSPRTLCGVLALVCLLALQLAAYDGGERGGGGGVFILWGGGGEAGGGGGSGARVMYPGGGAYGKLSPSSPSSASSSASSSSSLSSSLNTAGGLYVEGPWTPPIDKSGTDPSASLDPTLTRPGSLEFATFSSLSGGSAGIIAAVDRGGGGSIPPCYDISRVTSAVQHVVGMPQCLEVGGRYTVTIQAEDQDGKPRECGGDYFEILLYGGGDMATSGPVFLKRPWITDLGTGNYTLEIHVPALPHLVGDFVLNIHPLFLQGSGFGRHGPLTLKKSVARLGDREDTTLRLFWGAEGSCALRAGGGGGPSKGGGATKAAEKQDTPATPPSSSSSSTVDLAKNPQMCRYATMKEPAWRGYWLRAPAQYGISNCEPPYCAPGSAPILSVMDDNKELWVYRRESCVFRLWHPREARRCLNGKSLLGMGDSNLQDSLRNLMMHALQVDPAFFIPNGDLYLDRTFNFSGTLPATVSPGYGDLPQFALQMGMVFTGHWNIRVKGGLGVKTYLNESWLAGVGEWWDLLPEAPDFLVVNDAGLHTNQWTAGEPQGVAEAARLLGEVVVPWWLKNHKRGSTKHPRLVFRSNVVPGHDFKVLKANPQSLEAQNAIAAAELLKGLDRPDSDIKTAAIVDFYDMTFPFHYYDFYGDGGHYGRPIYYLPPGRTTPFTHFVDDQCVQVLLTGFCT